MLRVHSLPWRWIGQRRPSSQSSCATLNSILHHVQQGREQQALRLIENADPLVVEHIVLHNGGISQMGLPSCNLFLGHYGRNGKLSAMKSVRDRMLTRGFVGNVQTFNILLAAYGKFGHNQPMVGVVHDMLATKTPPNVDTYLVLFAAYWKLGDPEELHELRATIECLGLPPSTFLGRIFNEICGEHQRPQVYLRLVVLFVWALKRVKG